MTNKELLENESSINNVHIDYFDFKSEKLYGLYVNGNIAINKNLTEVEKACTLAEELGHHYTSSGNILDLSSASNRKQELKVRLWGYDKLIGLSGIVRAFENRCMNYYEVATYLEVTEEFLKEALDCYMSKYGVSVQYQNYVIYFEPRLCVVKMI